MYNSKNYTEQGGERTVIGGALVFEEGSTIEGFPGAANQADSTATTVATLGRCALPVPDLRLSEPLEQGRSDRSSAIHSTGDALRRVCPCRRIRQL